VPSKAFDPPLPPSTPENPESSSYLDCVILHSPYKTIQETVSAWNLLESYVPDHIRCLGISNIDYHTLLALCESPLIKHKPVIVQNRFYPRTGFDSDIRRFCIENGIVFESFWTLTGNPQLLKSEPVAELAKESGVSKEIALYSLVMAMDIAVLNGTTNEETMKEDLKAVESVRNWGFVYGDKWLKVKEAFKVLVDGKE
jgi:diketogulonate reductase-like aldo/keto reductase